MDERSPGLILRVHPLTETSLIIHWLTPDLGRLGTVAKGARRPKSPFRGKLDLFYLADFSFARSRRSDLHTLREVELRETHPALRRDLAALQQAAYAAGLVEQATETETPLPEIFRLMLDFLGYLAQHSPELQVIFAFEVRLLEVLGLCPDLAQARLSPGAKQILTALLHSDPATISHLKLTSPQTIEVSSFLHDLLSNHLGRPPKGRARLFGASTPHG